jgi:hypothetical protein
MDVNPDAEGRPDFPRTHEIFPLSIFFRYRRATLAFLSRIIL